MREICTRCIGLHHLSQLGHKPILGAFCARGAFPILPWGTLDSIAYHQRMMRHLSGGCGAHDIRISLPRPVLLLLPLAAFPGLFIGPLRTIAVLGAAALAMAAFSATLACTRRRKTQAGPCIISAGALPFEYLWPPEWFDQRGALCCWKRPFPARGATGRNSGGPPHVAEGATATLVLFFHSL